MLTTDRQTNTQSSMTTCWNYSLDLVKKGKIEFCLIFDDFRNDVITSAMDVHFLHFYNQQKYMIIGFYLTYNFNLSWIKHNFNRGYKLLHVFSNTLYIAEIFSNVTLSIQWNFHFLWQLLSSDIRVCQTFQSHLILAKVIVNTWQE